MGAEPLADVGLVLDRPFTRAQLVASGLDPGILRRREYKRVLGSVWVRVDAIDDDTEIRAALAIHPEDAVASHFSACRLLRLPTPPHPFEHVTVFQAEHRRFRPEIKSHVTTRPRRILSVRGIPTLDPVTTFIQMAGQLSLVDLVVIGDVVVRNFDISPAQLLRRCRSSTDYYAKRAAHAATYVRRGVDSPMETRLRMLIVLAGLPEPQTDVRLRHDDGTLRRRFDLAYPRIKLIIEYDGRQHAEDRAQWNKDLDRREELDDEGYRILVVTAKGIFVEPERTLTRIRAKLVALGWGDVPPIGDGWIEHFAVRN
jgi:very-short-patch-repair endonuclease